MFPAETPSNANAIFASLLLIIKPQAPSIDRPGNNLTQLYLLLMLSHLMSPLGIARGLKTPQETPNRAASEVVRVRIRVRRQDARIHVQEVALAAHKVEAVADRHAVGQRRAEAVLQGSHGGREPQRVRPALLQAVGRVLGAGRRAVAAAILQRLPAHRAVLPRDGGRVARGIALPAEQVQIGVDIDVEVEKVEVDAEEVVGLAGGARVDCAWYPGTGWERMVLTPVRLTPVGLTSVGRSMMHVLAHARVRWEVDGYGWRSSRQSGWGGGRRALCVSRSRARARALGMAVDCNIDCRDLHHVIIQVRRGTAAGRGT